MTAVVAFAEDEDEDEEEEDEEEEEEDEDEDEDEEDEENVAEGFEREGAKSATSRESPLPLVWVSTDDVVDTADNDGARESDDVDVDVDVSLRWRRGTIEEAYEDCEAAGEAGTRWDDDLAC